MDKKINYLPVENTVAKQIKKPLMQGSLQEHETNQSKNSIPIQTVCTNEDDAKCEVNKYKVVRNSPASMLHHSTKSRDKQTVLIDVPPTLLITPKAACNEIRNDSTNSVGDHSVFMNEQSHAGLHSSAIMHSQYHNTFDKKENSCNEVVKRRKPAVKVVASRYMTKPPTKNASYIESTSHKKKTKTKSSLQLKPIPKPIIHSTSKVKPTKDANTIAKASTPNAGFKTFFDVDMSTIQVAASSKPKKQLTSEFSGDEITQDDLNLLYSKYIRIAFIKASLEKSSDTRNKSALAEISTLNNVNIKLQEEVSLLEIEVNELENAKRLNDQLNVQMNALGPVVNALPNTCAKYKELVDNIDTTRHGLSVENVSIQQEDNLLMALQQTRNVVEELSVLTQIHSDISSSTATCSAELQHMVDDEEEVLSSVEELSVNLTKLSEKETNLTLQLNTENIHNITQTKA